jgi:hypothetical protein
LHLRASENIKKAQKQGPLSKNLLGGNVGRVESEFCVHALSLALLHDV